MEEDLGPIHYHLHGMRAKQACVCGPATGWAGEHAGSEAMGTVMPMFP